MNRHLTSDDVDDAGPPNSNEVKKLDIDAVEARAITDKAKAELLLDAQTAVAEWMADIRLRIKETAQAGRCGCTAPLNRYNVSHWSDKLELLVAHLEQLGYTVTTGATVNDKHYTDVIIRW